MFYRLNDIKKSIPNECPRRGRLSQVVEPGPNFKSGHHATHENWPIDPIFDDGATVVPEIDIPLGIDAHRWARPARKTSGEASRGRDLTP